MSTTLRVACALSAVGLCAGIMAESITHSGTTINMDFVDIGYAGNDADGYGYGSVGYNYRIGKYEVSAAQWYAVSGIARLGGESPFL